MSGPTQTAALPIEPTPAMIEAGAREIAAIKRRTGYFANSPRDIWRAMAAAAKATGQ